MKIFLLQTIQSFFFIYTILLIVRIVGSWFPQLARYRIMHLIYEVTEPYLGLFRRIIPPIGGVLDLSPLLAFFALQLMEYFLIALIR